MRGCKVAETLNLLGRRFTPDRDQTGWWLPLFLIPFVGFRFAVITLYDLG